MTGVELYDVENGLREIARRRRRRDDLTVATAGIAGTLASHMARHFGPEATETAGLALVIAAASVGGLTDLTVPVVANILALTGQRLVADSRAADEVAS